MSNKGIENTAKHEGLRLKAYDDAQPNKNITSKSQVIGTLTIGYGHTAGVYVGQTCTVEQAKAWLKEDVRQAESDLTRDCQVALTQNMVDALVDMYFNIGGTRCKTSTFMKRLNSGDYVGCANAFLMWSKPEGIIKRRKDAQALFLQDMTVLPYFTGSGAVSGSNVSPLAITAVAAIFGLS